LVLWRIGGKKKYLLSRNLLIFIPMQFLLQLLIGLALFSSCKETEPVKHIDLTKQAWYNQYTKDTVDAVGNHYIAGKYNSDTLTIQTIRLINPNKKGGTSIYIAKFDSTGKVLWAQTAGGDSYDDVNDIAFDSKGNLIITGDFRSSQFKLFGLPPQGRPDFILLNNRNNTTSNDGDMYVAKYNRMGALVFAAQGGGGRSDIGWSVTTNTNDEIIVEGTCISDSIHFNTGYSKVRSMAKNGTTYESLNFRVTYDANGSLIDLVEKDAGSKLFNKKFNEYFAKCLNEFKIKISCGGCTGVYFNFSLTVNENGKLTDAEIKRSRFCNEKTQEKFENKLREFLKVYNFPDELKGKKFDFNLNRVLKC
jgi:hypothetical protein